MSLRKAGYDVITAESGEDALDRVSGAHPALVVSDTHLPGMDGYAFCKQLKEDPRFERLPIIFLTQQEALQEKIRGLEMGVEEYLTKPIFIKELLIRIKMVLQKKQREVFTDQDGETTIRGTLAEMSVVDLIQTIEMGRKSGIATLTGEEGQAGTIYFQDGGIIDAEDGEVTGQEGIYALLGWADGEFVVEFQDVSREPAIDQSNQSMLMEGMRRVDEWSRIRAVVPDMKVALAPDHDRAAELRGEMSPTQSMALALTDGSRSVDELCSALAMDDLEILTAVRQLVEMGALRDPGAGADAGRVKLEDIPQPTAYGEALGSAPTEPEPEPEPEQPALTEEVVGASSRSLAEQGEDYDSDPENSITQNFGSAVDLPEPDSVETPPRPTLKFGELREEPQSLQETGLPNLEIPPEEMEDDGVEPPLELPPEDMEDDGEEPPPVPAEEDDLPPIPEDADEPPPVPDEDADLPPVSADEDDLPPIPEEDDDLPPPVPDEDEEADAIEDVAGASSRSLKGEDAGRYPLMPDDDEEAAAIEDEEPPPQITAALTDNTEELAGEVSLLKDREPAQADDPVYLLSSADEQKNEEPSVSAEEKAEEKAEEEAAAEKTPTKEPKSSRKRGRKKKDKKGKGKKGKKRKKTKTQPGTGGRGEVIPFPNQPAAAKRDDGPPAGRNQGAAQPAPKLAVADAAAQEAAARAGCEDPSEASINVRDEEFFNSDYMEDDLAAFDESLIVPPAPPSKLRTPAILIILVALIGAGITTYLLVSSPYIGDGPEHLRVDPASLARQAQKRQKAENARREAAEKEQAAFLSGKGGKKATPAPAPQPETEPAKPEPVKPEPAKPEPAKPEPAKPEPAKPEPAQPAPGGDGYDTLLAEGKALLKKYKKRHAMKKFKAAVKANPDGWEALEQLALYNMELGRMGTAYKLAKKVLGLNPNSPYGHLVVGGMLQERGKTSAARKSYTKFVRLCPSCRYAKDIRAVLKSM